MTFQMWDKTKEFFAFHFSNGKGPLLPSFFKIELPTLYEESHDTATADHNRRSFTQALWDDVELLEDFHFPTNLIGGCCPRVIGEEQEIVWNAAAGATGTERVHITWNAVGDKIWYLAIASTDQASHPNTWCPFSSLLPGLKDATAPPVIYTFCDDATAIMMAVLPKGLQIHQGTPSVVLAKAERFSRENDEALIVDLRPEIITDLTPSPWLSVSLFEERARRILATVSILSALVVVGIGILIWLFAAMSTLSAHTDTERIKERSVKASSNLLKMVQTHRASPMREHVASFTAVNDGLLSVDGFLEIYIIENNRPLWRAIVPRHITAERIQELGAQTLDPNDERGLLIGNSLEALQIDATGQRRGLVDVHE